MVSSEVRKSKCVKLSKYFGYDCYTNNIEEDHQTLKQALSSLDVNLWEETVIDEMDSLESNKTWHLLYLPQGCKTIGSKWILKRKMKPDGI